MSDIPQKALEILPSLMRERAERRSCGSCKLCCTVVEVELIEGEPVKATGTPCPHLCDHGCGIYKQRPVPCRSWYCGWRLGAGYRASRPDRCGLTLALEIVPFVRYDGYLSGDASIGSKDRMAAIQTLVQDGYMVRLFEPRKDGTYKYPMGVFCPDAHPYVDEAIEWGKEVAGRTVAIWKGKGIER